MQYVEQEPGIRILTTRAPCCSRSAGANGDGYDLATLKPDGTFAEHSGIDVHGDVTAVFHDSLDGVRKRGHVIPVSVADRNAFDLTQANSRLAQLRMKIAPSGPVSNRRVCRIGSDTSFDQSQG